MTKKILLVDTERGAGGFRSMPNVEIYDAFEDTEKSSFQRVNELVWHFIKNQSKLDGYEYIVIDTVSSLYNNTFREFLIPTQNNKQPANLWDKRGIYLSNIGKDYGSANKQVAHMLTYFRKLPIPTIFVAHEKDYEEKESKITYFRPDVTPGLLSELSGWSHLIVHMGRTAEAASMNGSKYPMGSRRLRLDDNVHQNTSYMAKARHRVDLPPLPPVILEPKRSDLLKVMEESGEQYPWVILYGPPGIGKTSLVVGAEYGKIVEPIKEEETANA